MHMRLRHAELLRALEPIASGASTAPSTPCPSPSSNPVSDFPPLAAPSAQAATAREPLVHRDRLLARKAAKADAAAASAARTDIDRSTCCLPAHRRAVEQPTDVSETTTSMGRPSEHRMAEYRHFEVSGFSQPRTETTPETVPEISADSSSSAREVRGQWREGSRRGDARWRAEDLRRARHTIAPAIPCTTTHQTGRHGSLPLRYEPPPPGRSRTTSTPETRIQGHHTHFVPAEDQSGRVKEPERIRQRLLKSRRSEGWAS